LRDETISLIHSTLWKLLQRLRGLKDEIADVSKKVLGTKIIDFDRRRGYFGRKIKLIDLL
tara:strand:+ start:379 stop:558 length:180 start_codon:yes stop_codon:yes gene_type:complete